MFIGNDVFSKDHTFYDDDIDMSNSITYSLLNTNDWNKQMGM